MNLLSCDLSNWDSPMAENNAACLAQSCTGPPVIRDSLESQRLSEISVAQHDAIEAAGRPTMGYAWASTALGPEANAQATVQLIDGHCSTKRIWADVEDYTNFIKSPLTPVPKRLLATLIANGFSPAILDPVLKSPHVISGHTIMALKNLTLAAIAPVQAVAWLRAWVNEIRTLGYIPGLYSAPGVWNDLCGGDTSFSDVDGWGAAWLNVPITIPPSPWGGIQNWCGVQYLPGGSDPTMCGMPLDLDAWDSDRLGVIAPPTPPTPPDGPPVDNSGYVTRADFDRLNSVLVWRMNGIQQAIAAAGQYLDPNNTPPQ